MLIEFSCLKDKVNPPTTVTENGILSKFPFLF